MSLDNDIVIYDYICLYFFFLFNYRILGNSFREFYSVGQKKFTPNFFIVNSPRALREVQVGTSRRGNTQGEQTGVTSRGTSWGTPTQNFEKTNGE